MKPELIEKINTMPSQKKALLILKLRNRQRKERTHTILSRKSSDTVIPLSPGQEGIWMYEELETESRRFLLPGMLFIKGPLQVDLFEKTINTIIARHESLRTCISLADDFPVQEIADEFVYKPVVHDLRKLSLEEKKNKLTQLFSDETRIKFDLTQLPLMRILLIRMEEEFSYVVLNIHHIISDEISFEIFRNELIEIYTSLANGETAHLPVLPIQFADYSVWKQNGLKKNQFDSQIVYWKEQLAGNLCYLDLPFSPEAEFNPVSYKIRNEEAKYFHFDLPCDTLEQLRNICYRENVTLFLLFFALFSILLYRITGQTDIIISTPVSNRKYPEIENLIGYFVNMVLLRIKLNTNASFREMLNITRSTVTGSFSNQEIPLNILFKLLQIDSPLENLASHVVFNYISSSQKEIHKDQFIFGQFEYAKEKISHNLGFFVDDRGNKIITAISYKKSAFYDTVIEDMVNRFLELIDMIIRNPECKLYEFEHGTDKRKNIIIADEDLQFNF